MPASGDKTLRHRILPWITAVAIALTAPAGAASSEPDTAEESGTTRASDISSQKVIRAIERGIGFLRKQQRPKGDWEEWAGRYHGGTTALSLLAMLVSGVPQDDPAIQSGLKYLDESPNTSTYAVSLKCQVYSLLGQTYRKQLTDCASWLIQKQSENGMWNYGYEGADPGDHSNTQFALLGLHMAQIAGVNVPAEIWSRSKNHFGAEQLADGGWNYKPGDNTKDGYGSMTAAGVASLYVAQQHLAEKSSGHVFVNGRYVDCGKFDQTQSLQSGLAWLAKNFNPAYNSGPTGQPRWLFYYLYGVERVGMISGLRFFGEHDWYRQGAIQLLKTQQADGSWGAGGDLADMPVQTAFALLFLAKGDRPVVVQKLQWDGKWNRNIHDLENLTGFIGDKLGKPLTWQNISLAAPLEQLREVPLLVITGHEFPKLTDAERQVIRQFVEGHGTLLAEACCGSKEFTDGFNAFLASTFPETRLRPMPLEHPVFHSYFDMSQTYGLGGLEGGCRTNIFFSPRALSALWQLQDVPQYSEIAFELGTNLVSYALGDRQLGTKLDPAPPPEVRKAQLPPDVPPGAVQIATLLHEGDFSPDPHAIANLALLIKQTSGLDVMPLSQIVKPLDKDLFIYPVVFMSGHFDFTFTPEQVEALRSYLQRGGVLVAEPCCGAKEFDQAFRRLVGQLLPDSPLKPLPADHAIYTGKVGVQLGQLTYRPVLAQELGSPNTTTPPLEAAIDKGRVMVLYSPYDFSCALEGDNPSGGRGYVDADGQRLALALFLFAIGY